MAEGKKEWMLGLPGHNNVISLDEVLLLVKGGQLRPTDLVKKLGQPWRAANEIPELAEYFSDGPKKEAPRAPLPKGDPPKPTTRISKPETPRAPSPPARETRSIRRPEPAKVDTHGATDVVAKAAAPEPPKPAEAPVPPKETRPIPKPPPREIPRLEPMVAKYFSPVDMLRSASFSFEPKKLLVTAVLATALMIVWSLLMHLAGAGETNAQRALYLAGWALVILGVAFILTSLAIVTRRQLEGQDWTFGETIGFVQANFTTALIYPVLVAIPSLLSMGILWIMGLLRNSSTGFAGALKIFYIVPMAFALVSVFGILIYQLASMYVPIAAAVEGASLSGAVSTAWSHVRRQWGRVVLHWLIVTVAFGVISAVCLGLATLTLELPEFVFGSPRAEVYSTWASFGGVMAIYKGLTTGLGLALPLSLLSTLGALSYVSLRQPAAAQLGPVPPEETSHDALPSASKPAVTPMEATHPAETRPAPADYDGSDSRPASPPAIAPPPSITPVPPVSDDTDEQPIAK